MSLSLLACALVLADVEIDAAGVIKALRTIYSKVKARGRGWCLLHPRLRNPKTLALPGRESVSPRTGERVQHVIPKTMVS